MKTCENTIGKNWQWGATFGFYAPRGYYASPEARAERTACYASLARRMGCEAFCIDFLSLSYYCRAREEADRGRDLSVGDMMDRLSGAHDKVEAIAKALGKPVVFGECGCGSIRDGAATPSWFSPFAEADEEEQARYMDALFGVFAREDWCLGFHWWKWDQHSPVKAGARPAQTRERDFTIRGKKAEGVFSR